ASPRTSAQAGSPSAQPTSRQASSSQNSLPVIARNQFVSTRVYPGSVGDAVALLASALGGETIAGAAHGLHQALIGRSQRLAQAADVHIHGALFDIYIAAPDLIQQLATGVGALLVGHEELQQPVFGRADLRGCAIDGNAVADRVQVQ